MEGKDWTMIEEGLRRLKRKSWGKREGSRKDFFFFFGGGG